MEMSFKTWMAEQDTVSQQQDIGEPEDEKAMDDVKNALATTKPGPGMAQKIGNVMQRGMRSAKSPEGIAKLAKLQQGLAGIMPKNMKKMKKKMKK